MTYSAKDIEVLDGLEGVRRKPGMYIGPIDSRGVFQSTKEIIDNVFDENLAGHCNKIWIAIEDETVTIADNGRGIPVEQHHKTKESTLTTIFTKLHAGGKINKTGGAYKVSVGTHGVGASCTNALSETFEVWTFRKGWWYQKFSKGKPKTKVVKQIPPRVAGVKMEKGTIIRFVPDYTCFAKGSKLNVKNLREWLVMCSYLYSDLTLNLDLNGKKEKLRQPDGIKALIAKLVTETNSEKFGKLFYVKTQNLDVVLQWSSYDEEKLLSYANGSKTDEGGTHLTGLYKAVNESLKPYRGARSSYKPEDLRCGLLGIIDFKLAAPQFDSQTKSRLISKEATEIVYEQCFEALKKFWKENSSTAKEIIRRANEVRSAVQDFQLSRKAATALKVNKGGKTIMPPKLVQCNCKNPQERELYIVEGDSAAGTAEDARNAYNQMVLPLRGKILNVYKDKGAKTFESEEIINILKSVGYDPSKKRNEITVGKIILLPDADEDGKHIGTLLMSLFSKVMPDLIRQGKIYTVDASLFMCKYNAKVWFGSSLQDVMKKSGGKGIITRVKGWGELDAPELKQVAFDVKTRKLSCIRLENNKQLKHFVNIMGENADTRKELLGL